MVILKSFTNIWKQEFQSALLFIFLTQPNPKIHFTPTLEIPLVFGLLLL